MKIEVTADAEEAAHSGARLIAEHIMMAIASRGHACIAISGGRTPWTMLEKLAGRELPWAKLHVFQVDERECSIKNKDRNYKHIKAILPKECQIHPMPVEDPDKGADHYAHELVQVLGKDKHLDVVHLGLGADGHTASLVPGDPVLQVTNRDVAWTEPYQGHRRMTLTYPIINRARFVFWLVTGSEKSEALARLAAGDPAIPATGIRVKACEMIADKKAADTLPED
ncbi:MAG TPA: 6-phosphogluconolactonase [Gammaproteobacteria bacterium]|nr:6-phosphogluconolactonase [Gammaproteobacteria bacterium]